jgi:hypothetical protein
MAELSADVGGRTVSAPAASGSVTDTGSQRITGKCRRLGWHMRSGRVEALHELVTLKVIAVFGAAKASAREPRMSTRIAALVRWLDLCKS